MMKVFDDFHECDCYHIRDPSNNLYQIFWIADGPGPPSPACDSVLDDQDAVLYELASEPEFTPLPKTSQPKVQAKPESHACCVGCPQPRPPSFTTPMISTSSGCQMSRGTSTSMAIFATMPKEAHILLFTPVLIPECGGEQTLDESKNSKAGKDQMDPFEALGRALNAYHKGVKHVPYVPGVGFTDIHQAFAMQADAIITVVCEPDCNTEKSIWCQGKFAEKVLDCVQSKEANAVNNLVLARFCSNEVLMEIEGQFVNVVDAGYYNAQMAEELARTIFRFNIEPSNINKTDEILLQPRVDRGAYGRFRQTNVIRTKHQNTGAAQNENSVRFDTSRATL